MQATFNHLITSFGMLVQGVSDCSILRVLVDEANVLIKEIIKHGTCFDCGKTRHFQGNLSCSHYKQCNSKVVAFTCRDGPLVSNSDGEDTPAQADEILYLQPAAVYSPFGT